MTGITFFNVWQADSRTNQEGLIEEMRAEAPALAAKDGFISLTAWRAEGTDYRVLVEGRWVSRAQFDAAVSDNAQAMASRARLETFAKPTPGIFVECFRFTAVGHEARPLETLLRDAANRWKEVGFETKRIRAGQLSIQVASAGEGLPVVLLHGYPQSGEIWRRAGQELAKKRQVIIPDLPGMGLSDIKRQGYDLSSIAGDIHAVVDALGLKEVDLIGHDWGGAVAAVYALRYRQQVRRLAFIESALGGAGFENAWVFAAPNPALTFIPFLLAEDLSEELVAGREEIWLRHLWKTFTHNTAAAPFAEWQPYLEAMQRPGLFRASGEYYRAVYGGAEEVRKLIAAGKLTIPVLCVSGDASFGAAQLTFVEAFASNIARHAVIPGSGHFVPEEQPQALLSELKNFLEI
jgi:pimeloyl-ACP methyl ester carboxylesterase/heme-degrading monooxygenase HmoA